MGDEEDRLALVPVNRGDGSYGDLEELEDYADATGEAFVSNTLPDPAVRMNPKITVKQAVAKYGKRSSSTLIEQEKTKAFLVNREIIRRLQKDPTQFKAGELNFIAGTSVDKIAKKERWDRVGDESGAKWVETFVAKIAEAQAGVTFKLEVTPRAKAVDAEVIEDAVPDGG